MVESRVVSPAFVGRAEDLTRLLAEFRSAAVGPRIALVAGEAGIGKTRLVAEFVDAVGSGARVVTGACTPLDGDGLGYAPLVAVLRGVIRGLGAQAVAARLPGDGRELARWFPELGIPSAGDKLRLYEEVLAVVELAAADRPLVVVVEDAHWADPASAELLGFMARNLTAAGVLLLVTYRDTDAAVRGGLLAELRRHGGARIRLDPFTRHEVARQLAAIVGERPDPAMARRVHERSDGNPLFVETIAQSGEAAADGARELLLQVPHGLEASRRAVLDAMSVSTVDVSHELLASITERGDVELDAILADLIADGLLSSTQDGYRFRHDLIRQAVYEDLLAGQRKRWHARFAERLRDGNDPAALAAHGYAAGMREVALDAAWRAADAACRSYAYVEEAHHLDRVLELWEAVPDAAERLGLDRAEVCVHAAECCMLSGDYPRGIAYATAGLGFVDEAREPERAARLLEYRGRLRDRTDATGMADLERSYDLFVLASKAAGHGRGAAAGANNREPSPEAPTPTTWDIDRGRLLGLRAMATVRADAEAAFALGTEALVIGRRTADPTVTIRGLLVVGAVTSHLDLLAEALSITEDIRDHDLMITALMYLAIHHGRHGDQPSSARAAAEGMRRAQRLGLARSRGTHLAGYLAKAQLLSGRADAAAATVNEALAEDPPPMSAGILHAVEAHVAVLRGDLDTASELAERLSLDDERLGTHFFHRCQVLALVALARGESARVGELLDTALANPSFRVVPAVELRPLLLVAALNPDTVARAADLSRSLPVDGLLDAAYHELIDALTTSGASDAWGSVIPVWRERGHPWELALSLGFAARAADRADTSGSLRTEAEAIAERLGAQKLYAALVPAPEFDAARSELSQRELEVLALIAEGLSNRQIAAKLYISPSTAGVHVSHILTKLGAANRTEAATIAHQRGLV